MYSAVVVIENNIKKLTDAQTTSQTIQRRHLQRCTRVALLHSGIVTVIKIAQKTLCSWQLFERNALP
jgi:hypothetical protein